MKRLTTLQLLIALEDHGVIDIFVSDDQIVLVHAGRSLDLPAWLRAEYVNHREDLLRQLRRVRRITFAVGVFT